VRVKRRLVDRLVSVFAPVQRFRCPELDCQWEGNLSSKHLSAP